MGVTVGETQLSQLMVTCLLVLTASIKLSKTEFSISELIVDDVIRYNCTIDDTKQFNRIPKDAVALRLGFSASNRIDFGNWSIPSLDLLDILEIDVSFIPQPLPVSLFMSLRHVAKLTLYHRLHSSVNFSVHLPEKSFNDCLNLRSLNLPALGLEVLPEDAFRGLTNLRSLDLNQNRLTSIPFGIFTNCCKNMISLNLAKNHLTSTHSLKPVTGLLSLRQLNLYGNHISEIPARSFLGMDSLSDLNLEHNQLQRLESGAFEGLISLRKLYVDGNQLTSIAVEMFSGLTHLKQLDLGGNRFTELPSGGFSTLKSLSGLSLRKNHIYSILPGAFLGLKELEVLELQENLLSAIDSSSLRGLEDLRVLYLDNNHISVISPDLFLVLHRLSELNINHNALEFLPLGFFEGARWLSTLDISRNPWICDHCDALWLAQWASNMSGLQLENRFETLCASPIHFRNQSIFDLQAIDDNGTCAMFLIPTSTAITTFTSSSVTMTTTNDDESANRLTQIVIQCGLIVAVFTVFVFLLTWCHFKHSSKWYIHRNVSSRGTTTTVQTKILLHEV